MIDKKWSRFAALVGNELQENIANQKIAIFGMGAVGSFTTEFLARCGASNLTLIDFDHVTPSNFNRLITATESTIKQSKTAVMRERVLAINPEANVTAIEKFINPENVAAFLKEQTSGIIIDAIDSLNPKLALLEAALVQNRTIFSSMGAGGRLNTETIHTGDLWETHSCRLATQIRKRLRRRNITAPLPVVFSSEIGKKPLPPEELAEEEKSIYHDLGRARSIQPSVVYIPAIFGAHLTEMVIEYCKKNSTSSKS